MVYLVIERLKWPYHSVQFYNETLTNKFEHLIIQQESWIQLSFWTFKFHFFVLELFETQKNFKLFQSET